MKKLLLCASVVLICYFAADVAQVTTYPVTITTPTVAIRTAKAK